MEILIGGIIIGAIIGVFFPGLIFATGFALADLARFTLYAVGCALAAAVIYSHWEFTIGVLGWCLIGLIGALVLHYLILFCLFLYAQTKKFILSQSTDQ